MKEAIFHHLGGIPADKLSDAVQKLRETPEHRIESHNWGIGTVLPEVTFRCGWNSSALFLLYEVNESESLRRFKTVNAPVWRDSCVEFFIQPDEKRPVYCNFEFNSMGTLLSQTGPDRENRTFIDSDEASDIRTEAQYIENKEGGGGNWMLAISIPEKVLKQRGVALDGGNQYRCNFYKCGDDLKDPHYLSWNPVETAEPDFHRPEYFGRIILKSEI